MAKVWVLDTETKGTGARMIPLEQVQEKPQPAPDHEQRLRLPPKPRPRPAKAPEPHAPRRFRVVDAMTRQVVAEDAGTREAIAALEGFRSMVDVSVYAWEEKARRWRLLTLRERRALWDLRGR